MKGFKGEGRVEPKTLGTSVIEIRPLLLITNWFLIRENIVTC
jgi:hypothetical protein